MKTPKNSKKDGAVLVIVMVILVSFTLFVAALMQLGAYNAQETERQVREAQSFWIAEEGVQQSLLDQNQENDGNGLVAGDSPYFDSGTDRAGEYWVEDDGTGGFISYGELTVAGVTVTNRIRFETEAIDESYDKAISGLNLLDDPWTFLLGGTGDPDFSSGFPAIPGPGDTAVGGADEIWGDVYAGKNGDIWLGGDSSINPAISPNNYNFEGDANTSGGTVSMDTNGNPHISGEIYEDIEPREGPDLVGMDYPATADYKLKDIFDAALGEGVNGQLPNGHELRDVVRRRNGDEYYFEPISGSGSGWDLVLGDEKVYYAEGDIHFDRSGPYQFDVDGTVTIVASGNIHIGDGIRYQQQTGEEGDDLVALVALGEYDEWGIIEDGTGNIYFGDPRFGTVYEMDAFMLAANDFYYNLEENPFNNNNSPGEPDTGFKIFGNFVALNQLHIDRDWYSPEDGGDARPTLFVPGSEGGWVDAIDYRDRDSSEPITDFLLSEVEIIGGTITETRNGWHRERINGRLRWVNGPYEVETDIDPMRHYQMIVKYDERIHDPNTQPPNLPRAGGSGGSGGESGGPITHWEHYDDEG